MCTEIINYAINLHRSESFAHTIANQGSNNKQEVHHIVNMLNEFK